MAGEDGFQNMYDSRLKPQLLYSLMASHFPDEKQPSPNPSQLAAAVSVIRRHKLLSEGPAFRSGFADGKLADSWKGAVDAWNERVLSYVSSKLPDKCWVGVCMLGVTCQECNRHRFLESYSAWFQKLIAHLKPPTDSPFLRVAACASLSDLLIRLGGIPSLKKEGMSLAGKLVLPVLQLLGEDDSETVWNDATDLFCTILRCFPSSLQQQYDNAESLLVSKIMSGKCSVRICQKFARCLASLPRARGDGDSWYSMMQKVLLAINAHLNDSFQGLEDVNRANEAVVPLLPPGKDPPPPLGGPLVAAEAADQATKKFWQLLVPRVSLLVYCCCIMLTNPFPVQVTVPLRPLLALITRVLSVDGSLYQQSLPLGIGTQQAYLCSELPALHSCALDLLAAIIKAVRSQLLPRAADIVRLLTEYFRRCVSPALRIKLYRIARNLLISMGVGMASYLAPAVIYNAVADLKGSNCGASLNCPNITGQPNSTSTAGGGSSVLQSNTRKRKHVSGLSAESQVSSGLENDPDTRDQVMSIPVQISALQALEALLTVGGALRSDRWRADVDLVLVTVAMNASTISSFLQFCDEEDVSYVEESASFTTADFQLAAYKALLASLLSPCCHRPPYLSQGLTLFRKGRQEAGTELAEFCAHALLALEPLIHPRSLPYVATTVAMPMDRGTPGISQVQNSVIGQHDMQPADDIYPDDEIYLGWLGNGEDSVADQHNLYDNTEIPIESLVDTLTDNRGLPCSPLEDMANMASQQSPVHEEVLHSVCVEGLSSDIHDQNIGALPAGPPAMDKTPSMDMCKASQLRVDGTQDYMVGSVGTEIICSVGPSSSKSPRELVQNLMCQHEVTERPDAIMSNSRESLLPESATTDHMETLAIEATDTDVTVHVPQCETPSRLKMEGQPLENSSVPLAGKPSTVSSFAESDSDAIPDIVDGDPDTE